MIQKVMKRGRNCISSKTYGTPNGLGSRGSGDSNSIKLQDKIDINTTITIT